MMGSCNSKANSRKRDSTALSTANNSAFHKNQQPVLSSASTIQHEQSNNAPLDQINESVNDADECLIQKLQRENEELKVKLAASDEKNKRSGLYEDLIGELREKCLLKDEQLAEKDAHLADKADLIEFLKAEDVKKDAQLQSNSIEINELQEECGKKDKLLVDKENMIKKLQAKNNEKDVQLQSKSDKIDELQKACNSKDSQLHEKSELVDKLQEDCAENEKQTKATLDRLKSLGNSLHDSSKLVNALWNCGFESSKQNQRVEALLYYDNAIDLEKATQNRSSKLTLLFRNKAYCYYHLEQYQQCIDAANLALQHDPNNKKALNNRGVAYEDLKQYSNARQDYEKALQLDPSYELARRNLEIVQDLIDAASPQ